MSHKNLGPIGSAVLTFKTSRQTPKQTDKPNLYIDVGYSFYYRLLPKNPVFQFVPISDTVLEMSLVFVLELMSPEI